MNCIINVSNGAWYPTGAMRQRKSLRAVGYGGKYHSWVNSYPEGCPSHQAAPYAFKPYAFKWAIKQGYDSIIWMDSAVWAKKNPQPIFDQIDKDGYFVLQNGWTSGEWCTDRQLQAFDLTREEALKIPHPLACVVGINIARSEGLELFREYIKNVNLFPGAWTNENGEVSPDKRVLGSRHDQAVLGLIMHKLKLKYTFPRVDGEWLDYKITNKESILLTQGM